MSAAGFQQAFVQAIEEAGYVGGAPDNDAHEEQFYSEQMIGTLLLEGGREGADIWAYTENGDMWLEFKGWRSDRSVWYADCNLYDSVEKTLQTVCRAAQRLDQTPDYIRVTSINYTVDMPDCAVTRDATLNQCIDFPDQRWIDVRDRDEWYDVHMVVRRC